MVSLEFFLDIILQVALLL